MLGVSPDLLMADAVIAPVLRIFAHQELWRWAHDQSQAVVGWQPLPFLDGRTSRLLWINTTGTGAIGGAVVGIGGPSSSPLAAAGKGADTEDNLVGVFPGDSAPARAIRGRLASLLRSPLSVRIQGPQGVGKDFVASRLIDRHCADNPARVMDPLVLRGDQAPGDQVWLARLHDAVGQSRPVLFHDLDRVPEARIHQFLPALQKARERKVTVVATQSLQASEFAERMWARVFRDTVQLPGLDSRQEDIEAVALALWRAHFGRRAELQLSPDAARLLAGAEWSGNVAELEAVLLEARRRSGGDRIEAWSVRVPVRQGALTTNRIEAAEYEAIKDSLSRCKGNKSAAASLLGIARSTLYRKIRLYGIKDS
ncbi:helix-turn-helix domain-containing protein [Nocardiopsis nanhaiensis]